MGLRDERAEPRGNSKRTFRGEARALSPLLPDAIEPVRLGSTLLPEGSPRTRLRENRVRCRLCAGESRIRTFRPSPDQCLSELVEPCAETTWRARGEFFRGGTNSSNPSPSSGESDEVRS